MESNSDIIKENIAKSHIRIVSKSRYIVTKIEEIIDK